MNDDRIPPICNDGRTGDGAVDGKNNAFNAIRRGRGVLDVEPVFPGNPSVGGGVIVVGGDVVIPPARPVGSTVDASLGQGMVKLVGQGVTRSSQGQRQSRKSPQG